MSVIHVDIVSAEGEIWSGEAAMVFAPAELGEMGIAPRHAPLITQMKPGEVRVQRPDNDEELAFYVSGGILEVQPHQVTVLSDTAMRAADIDEAAAEAARKKAEAALVGHESDVDIAHARAELAAAMAQLQSIERLRKAAKR